MKMNKMKGSFEQALGNSFNEPTYKVDSDEIETTECYCCGDKVDIQKTHHDMHKENRYCFHCISGGYALVHELENCPPPPSEEQKTIEYFDNLKKQI